MVNEAGTTAGSTADPDQVGQQSKNDTHAGSNQYMTKIRIENTGDPHGHSVFVNVVQRWEQGVEARTECFEVMAGENQEFTVHDGQKIEVGARVGAEKGRSGSS